jgi:hypothetical protein
MGIVTKPETFNARYSTGTKTGPEALRQLE